MFLFILLIPIVATKNKEPLVFLEAQGVSFSQAGDISLHFLFFPDFCDCVKEVQILQWLLLVANLCHSTVNDDLIPKRNCLMVRPPDRCLVLVIHRFKVKCMNTDGEHAVCIVPELAPSEQVDKISDHC